MKLAVFILEDVLSIRPVTDSCYASSVKYGIKRVQARRTIRDEQCEEGLNEV